MLRKAAGYGIAVAIGVAPFALMGTVVAASFEPVAATQTAVSSEAAQSLLAEASSQMQQAAEQERAVSSDTSSQPAQQEETASSPTEIPETQASSSEEEWTEEAVTEERMCTILPCFSREKALEGAKVVDTLKEGAAVTVTAKTSTGYYKIKEGGYIYADFLEPAPEEEASSAPAQEETSSKASSSSASSSSQSQNQSSSNSQAKAPTDGSAKSILNGAALNPRKTGFTSLDNKINAIFGEIFTPDMDTYSKVKACYDYLIENTSYGRVNYPTTGFGSITPEGGDNYIAWAASSCLDNHVATCNRYSSAFIAMVRTIGLDARYVDGQTSAAAGGYTGHVWVEVVIDGTTYVFDPQVEDNISGGGTIRYLRFCKTYDQVPGKYIK